MSGDSIFLPDLFVTVIANFTGRPTIGGTAEMIAFSMVASGTSSCAIVAQPLVQISWLGPIWNVSSSGTGAPSARVPDGVAESAEEPTATNVPFAPKTTPLA